MSKKFEYKKLIFEIVNSDLIGGYLSDDIHIQSSKVEKHNRGIFLKK